MDTLIGLWEWLGENLILLQILIKIVAIIAPLMLFVAYFTYAERKIIGYMQVRIGPNRVGPKGWLQPIADAVKLMFKEIVIPSSANKTLFLIAPMLTLAPALAAWAVFPFQEGLVLSDLNAGLLYLLALTSVGVYGVIIAGWASNSKYAFLGAMRSAAQIVSYEIAMGFALVGVLVAAGSLNLGDIVRAQEGNGGLFNWFWLPLLPLFLIYFISGVAETNRAPFDVAEGESEIVAGFHVEYSGMAVRGFLPRRIRQHDPDLGADGAAVPGRLAVALQRLAGAWPAVRLGTGYLLAVAENGRGGFLFPLVARHLPPLSL